MPLVANRYGKGRVRIARVKRDGHRNEIRELSVQTLLEGGFEASYTEGDNSAVVATDTIKNLTNLVARENLDACAERYAEALARRMLDRYGQVDHVSVHCRETRWTRASIHGQPHPHTFLLDGNGHPTALVEATRERVTVTSGIADFTLMKTTQSGWAGYVMDDVTTLPETTDRILATAMDATWTWRSVPADYEAANAAVLAAMLDEFAGGYSKGVQDSLYRMGEQALAAVPALQSVTLACPNKHYLPIDLSRVGAASDNCVFTPTDEPHGQIECTVAR